MIDVSATGLKVVLSTTGFGTLVIDEFADDQSPLDPENAEVTGSGVGINGDLVVWSKPAAVTIRLSVIPDSRSDVRLLTLLRASKIAPGKGFIGAKANIESMVVTHPNNAYTATYRSGRILSGPPADAVNTDGRLQGRQYSFVFESIG